MSLTHTSTSVLFDPKNHSKITELMDKLGPDFVVEHIPSFLLANYIDTTEKAFLIYNKVKNETTGYSEEEIEKMKKRFSEVDKDGLIVGLTREHQMKKMYMFESDIYIQGVKQFLTTINKFADNENEKLTEEDIKRVINHFYIKKEHPYKNDEFYSLEERSANTQKFTNLTRKMFEYEGDYPLFPNITTADYINYDSKTRQFLCDSVRYFGRLADWKSVNYTPGAISSCYIPTDTIKNVIRISIREKNLINNYSEYSTCFLEFL